MHAQKDAEVGRWAGKSASEWSSLWGRERTGSLWRLKGCSVVGEGETQIVERFMAYID